MKTILDTLVLEAADLDLFDIKPADLVTIALLVALEGLLSADNAMVLAVLVLGLPTRQQRQALRYGIL